MPNPIDTLTPPLALDQIQGNVLAGFNKDHQRLLFLGITNAALAKKWLAALIPHIATTTQVKAFNDLFRARRKALGVDPPLSELSATWTNIAFTATGLAALGVNTTGMAPEFLAGMAARKSIIGDNGPSDPVNWQPAFKDPHKLHLLLHVAADDPAQLLTQTNTLLAGLTAGGLVLLLDQHGENLTGPMAGFEHFGFKDGISQPGVKSFTTSVNDKPAPGAGHQGVPGQDLLWPGEFVIGYPTQVPVTDPAIDGPNPAQGPISTAGPAAPAWTKNGSFLVFRKLAQDVPAFRSNMASMASTLGMDPGVLGAKLVGRFSSGCPMQPTPHEVVVDDLPTMTPVVSNGFPLSFDPNNGDPAEVHSEMLHPNLINDFEYGNDLTGQWVARAGHVRKAYPRDQQFLAANGQVDPASSLNESFTQTKRMLRRGIPYGPQIALPPAPAIADAAAAILAAVNLNATTATATATAASNIPSSIAVNPGTVFAPPIPFPPPIFKIERGLLFLAYQKSISSQFEFVQQSWINDPDFPQKGDGLDPIMSQTPHGTVTCPMKGTMTTVDVKHFVTTSGGEYFFQPSISALQSFTGILIIPHPIFPGGIPVVPAPGSPVENHN